MPDLGRYAGEVLLAYGASGAILGALIAVTLWQARAAKRDEKR